MERLELTPESEFGLYKSIFMHRIFNKAYELDENVIGSISYKQLRDIALALEQYKGVPKYGPYRDYVNVCAVELVETIKSSAENDNVNLEQYKSELNDLLEGECEYPLEVITEMTPRQKVKNWLEWNGIQDFTDDILDVISAAYNINLNRD